VDVLSAELDYQPPDPGIKSAQKAKEDGDVAKKKGKDKKKGKKKGTKKKGTKKGKKKAKK
jgi:hypothetical protein